MEIRLFGNKTCLNCKIIKKMLKGKKYEYYDIGTVDGLGEFSLLNTNGGVPTLWVDGNVYEGVLEVSNAINKLEDK